MTSRVAEVEVIRAARRAGPAAARRSQEVLRRIGLVELDAHVAESAGVVVAYDGRLLEAARQVGADVAKPA